MDLLTHRQAKLQPTVDFTNPFGAKCKCADAESLAQSVSSTKFYQYTQLEVMPNFYALRSVPYASKLSVILLAQNLLIK